MKAHYVILDPELLPSLVFTRVRDVLADEGGIRLYRNGFRVVPYGAPEDDWLRLDETYAKRFILVPLANRNFFGVIEVRDPEGQMFEEHTSREGLIETPAFVELRELASSVLVTAATRIAEDRGRKTRAGTPSLRPRPTSLTGLEDATAAAKAAHEAAQRAAREQRTAAAEAAARQTAEAARLLEEHQEVFASAQAQLADETAMLRFLATLGMTTAEFSHETGMTFDAFRFDFARVFDVATAARSGDQTFLDQATRAKSMLTRLDTLTSYLNSLAGARAARGMRPVSLSKLVENFERGMSAQARSQDVRMEVRTPNFDPLFTRPMHEAEVASVLLNFYTNAVKAVKRSGNLRRILVTADRVEEPEPRVRIQFADSGDGVPNENREKIFDPFFTTRTAPPAGDPDVEHARGTGLGLWIVNQIAANAGGEVTLADPPEGFSTCFELLIPPEHDGEQ